jgi:hypothetical protein
MSFTGPKHLLNYKVTPVIFQQANPDAALIYAKLQVHSYTLYSSRVMDRQPVCARTNAPSRIGEKFASQVSLV